MSSELIMMNPTYHNKFDNQTIISESGKEGEMNYSLSPSASEIIRGPVTLISSSHVQQKVILSIFRTSVDHFALVFPDNRKKMIAVKPVGCINLRGVSCEETKIGSGIKGLGFTLRPKKCDTSSAALIFLVEDKAIFPRWMSALQPFAPTNALGQRRMPRQCSLPSVEEED